MPSSRARAQDCRRVIAGVEPDCQVQFAQLFDRLRGALPQLILESEDCGEPIVDHQEHGRQPALFRRTNQPGELSLVGSAFARRARAADPDPVLIHNPADPAPRLRQDLSRDRNGQPPLLRRCDDRARDRLLAHGFDCGGVAE